VVGRQLSLLGGGTPAVDGEARVERVQLDGRSWVDLARPWLRGADTLLDALVGGDAVEWTQGRRWMFDRMVDDPRLSRWYGANEPLPHPALHAMRRALEHRYGVTLRGPALNYYRDGRDSVASHRDRELRELDDTLIAIVTLGAQRPFLVRPRGGGPSRDLSPASGDLLVMGGRTQVGWEHAVPKVAHAGPRISVTWRWSPALGAPDRTATGPRRAPVLTTRRPRR
jgi:alkylated DNA repair dioxygenase AlkB